MCVCVSRRRVEQEKVESTFTRSSVLIQNNYFCLIVIFRKLIICVEFTKLNAKTVNTLHKKQFHNKDKSI